MSFSKSRRIESVKLSLMTLHGALSFAFYGTRTNEHTLHFIPSSQRASRNMNIPFKRPSLVEGAIRRCGDPFERRNSQDGESSHVSETAPLHPSHDTTMPTPPNADPQEHVSDDTNAVGSHGGSHGGSIGASVGVSAATTHVTSNVSNGHLPQPNEQRSQVSHRSMQHSSSTVMLSNRQSDSGQVLRHVDDDCNTPDYEINIFFQLCEVVLQPQTATSTETTRWGNIRRWFTDHRNRKERYTACVQQGVFSTTPLHIVCQHPNCPLDIVAAMLECTVEIASWEDTNGWLPLHYACAKNIPFDVIRALLKAYPDGEVTQDKRMRTPLHFAFFKSGTEDTENGSKSSSTDAVEPQDQLDDEDLARVVYSLEKATMVGDEKGRLPLHFAAAYGTSRAALEALIDACPRSLSVKEDTGRTALHYAMANAHNDTSPCVLKCLLDNMDKVSIDDVDDDGNLPLHLLSLRAEGMHGETAGEKKVQENVIACLNMYLDASPKLSADILTALQSLPGWLRDNAVTHPHVQKILNNRITDRFPTSILLLDGYLYTLIVVCFSLASRSHIQYRFGAVDLPYYVDGALAACFIGITYFFLREIVQVMSMISLNTFRSWFLRFENWLDIILISLIYFYCGSMERRGKELNRMTDLGTADFGSQNDESFRTGVAFTIGALWLSVINFLKSTMLEFSVFYETMLYVSKNLFIFMISLAVILIAFAQMFLIVFRKTPVCSESCISEKGGFPHCSFNRSMLKVYTMMLGEIGEVNRYQQNLTAQLLYVAFVFLVVILLSNVLIAIVTDSHSVVKNERAEMVFWSNRLDFIAEMDTIEAMRNRFVSCVLRNDYSEQSQSPESQQRLPFSGVFRENWDHLVTFLSEKNSDDISLLEYYLFIFLRIIIVLLVIPLWFALGLFTAGSFWPPQIREWLFAGREGGRKDNAIENTIILEIKHAKGQIKDMSAELLGEAKRSKNEQQELCKKLEHIQNQFVNDVFEIKLLTVEMRDFAREQRKIQRRSRSGSISGSQHRHQKTDLSGSQHRIVNTRSTNRSQIARSRGDRSD
jgi:hypothetical protein